LATLAALLTTLAALLTTLAALLSSLAALLAALAALLLISHRYILLLTVALLSTCKLNQDKWFLFQAGRVNFARLTSRLVGSVVAVIATA
jgi:hypothetical protein